MCKDLENFGLSNLCGYGSFDFVVWDFNAAYLITQILLLMKIEVHLIFIYFYFFYR